MLWGLDDNKHHAKGFWMAIMSTIPWDLDGDKHNAMGFWMVIVSTILGFVW
jgi:hypothetical protein